MATTEKQDRDFLEAVISKRLLEEAIQWIADNMSPENVFSHEELEAWAENNGYTQSEE